MKSRRTQPAFPPRIVVMGGGPAGVAAAKCAAKTIPGAQVTLINRSAQQTNIADLPGHLATGKTVQADLVDVARKRNFKLQLGEVTAIEERHVPLADGTRVPFDYLVMALGGVALKAPGGNTLDADTGRHFADVERLRSKLLELLEHSKAPVKVTVIGAGLSGLEYATALAEAHGLRVEVSLVGPALQLPTDKQLPYTREHLQKAGVRLIENALVNRVEDQVVHFDQGGVASAVPTDLVLNVSGERGAAEKLAPWLPVNEHGRVKTRPTLQTEACDWIYAAGDNASMLDAKTQREVPQMVKMAEDSGRRAAQNIARAIEGKPQKGFHSSMPGWIASLGSKDAVGKVGPIIVQGAPASAAKNTLLQMQGHPAEIPDGWAKYLAMAKWFRTAQTPSRRTGRAP